VAKHVYSRFFEYKTKGPGAIVNEKHRQLNAQEAAQFTRDHIFGDWHPQN
jgi:pectinesterase